jgi:hypothetical protein
MKTCESFTRDRLGNHYNGDVCHSMDDNRLYAFGNLWGYVGIKKL